MSTVILTIIAHVNTTNQRTLPLLGGRRKATDTLANCWPETGQRALGIAWELTATREKPGEGELALLRASPPLSNRTQDAAAREWSARPDPQETSHAQPPEKKRAANTKCSPVAQPRGRRGRCRNSVELTKNLATRIGILRKGTAGRRRNDRDTWWETTVGEPDEKTKHHLHVNWDAGKDKSVRKNRSESVGKPNPIMK